MVKYPNTSFKKTQNHVKTWWSNLHYNHTNLEWKPAPPLSMLNFYHSFLKWRADAGMNNQISEDLPDYLKEAGFESIEIIHADEVYKRGDANFLSKIGVWSKVAGSSQMVEEGYISDSDRLKAIEEYNKWIETDAELMVMKLKEVRGRNNTL